MHRASVEAADDFFDKRAPDARRIADPDGQLFGAFGLERGSLMQLLGPAVWWRGLVAMLKGNFVGRPAGDVAQMPGAFVVRGDEILWAHRARHSGDMPDLAAMLRTLDPSAAAARPKNGKQARKLRARHKQLLERAREMQRSGDLRTFASLTAEAEEIAQQIEALEGQSA